MSYLYRQRVIKSPQTNDLNLLKSSLNLSMIGLVLDKMHVGGEFIGRIKNVLLC